MDCISPIENLRKRYYGVKRRLRPHARWIAASGSRGPLLRDELYARDGALYYFDDPMLEGKNLGDMLSPVIFRWAASERGIDLRAYRAGSTVLGVGSLLHEARPGWVVWGSGYDPSYGSLPWGSTHNQLDVRAVRGPLTAYELRRHHLGDTRVYGDPAVLLPRIYEPPQLGGSGVGLVSHYVDKSSPVWSEAVRGGISVMSMLSVDWQDSVNRLCAHDRILSTSLHGIILAEAYGIPAVYIASDRVRAKFKFEDYYLSTGRPDFPMVRSVREGLSVVPPRLPRMDSMRDQLIEAFPSTLALRSR